MVQGLDVHVPIEPSRWVRKEFIIVFHDHVFVESVGKSGT